MLSKPDSGWSLFQIEDFEFPFSYVRDTPQDFIDALIYGFTHGVCSVVMDGEGHSDCIFVINEWDCYVILDNYNDSDKIVTKRFQISLEKIAEMFVKDMEKYPKEWANWEFYNFIDIHYDLSKLKKLVDSA